MAQRLSQFWRSQQRSSVPSPVRPSSLVGQPARKRAPLKGLAAEVASASFPTSLPSSLSASIAVPCLLLVGVDTAPAIDSSVTFVPAHSSGYAIELLRMLRVDLVVLRWPLQSDLGEEPDAYGAIYAELPLSGLLPPAIEQTFSVDAFVQGMRRVAPRQAWALVAGPELSAGDEIAARCLGAVAIIDDVSRPQATHNRMAGLLSATFNDTSNGAPNGASNSVVVREIGEAALAAAKSLVAVLHQREMKRLSKHPARGLQAALG